jgi:DNA replication protein DnaC
MNPYKECDRCHAYYLCSIYQKETAKKNMTFCDNNFFVARNCKLAEIPIRCRGSNTGNFRKDNKALYDKVIDLATNIIEGVDKGTNIVITGACGTGKTFLACTLLNQYLVKTSVIKGRFDYETPTGMFLSYSDFIDSLRWKRDDKELDMDSKFDLACSVPLLVMDDIGSGKITDYSAEQTFILINRRYNNMLSTIITSNSLDELKTFLGERSLSRITEGSITFKLNESTDKRLG